MRRMFIALSLLAFHSALAQSPRTPAADSTLLRTLAQAELQFFSDWRAAWMIRGGTGFDGGFQSVLHEDFKHGIGTTNPAYMEQIRRGVDISCGIIRSDVPKAFLNLGGWQRIILSATSPYALCPRWHDDSDTVPQGHLAADSLARASMRGDVLQARTSLVARFDSAAGAVPGNGWIVGQQVRFHVDESDLDGALRIARSCRTNRWWCSTLTGYVLAARGEVVAADSAFNAGVSATTGDARCQWTDVRMLLAPKDRDAYSKLSCAQRDSVSANVWWLADPLFAQPGNERRVEHYVRKVSLALHGAVEYDELYHFGFTAGGDAVTEMVLRYGWPSKAYWSGVSGDADLDGVLRAKGRLPSSPHIAPEYTGGRVHLIPSWDALRSPPDSRPSSWAINPDTANWWPVEFFTPEKPIALICDDQTVALRRDPSQQILQIAEEQAVALRRQHDLLFAYATDLSGVNFSQRPGDTVQAILLHSPRPDSIQRVATQRLGALGRANLHGFIPDGAAVIAFEIPNAGSGLPPVRTRFGIRPPRSLAAMKPGERAISDPVILEAPSGDAALPNDPDRAIARMLGSTLLAKGTKQIGIYWETYGFAPTDSVEVSVRVQRFTSQNLLRVLGNAVSITGDKNAPILVSWKEPEPGHGANVIGGTVPIVARSVVLDISGLPRGEYWLDVMVSKRGAGPVTSRRGFTVR